MPLQSDFDIDPYWDDFDELKNFYKILYKPGVPVQTRELNQMQSIFQNQIERLGDNLFKRGTIIDGCNITLHPIFPYIKIKDLETDGTTVNVSEYENLYVRNSSNVTAYITKTSSGFETQAPNLNTLFVKYNNSGTSGNDSTFSANDILEVFDPGYPIFSYKVIDGSSSFSNNDTVVITSAIAIQNSSGGNSFPAGAFNVNDVINNGVANAIIVESNNTTNSEYLVLKLKPVSGDLATGNSILWKFSNSENILNQNTSNTAKIVEVIGSGARGTITTDSLGKVISISVANSGSGYYVPPQVSVSITSGGTPASNNDISQLDVEALNYKTNITVANSSLSPIGTGFGVTVDEGIIYQKGYFSRVSGQTIVANKYSNTGFTKSVGFYTEEQIINSNQDTSLLDNATGTYNYTAPGADRLKLTPVLYVLDKSTADSNTEFFPIIEFADGVPYKQAKQTVYNIIGDEIAKRTAEESGNYVLDQFLLTTKDSNTFSETANVFKMVIDPGKAYIKGYRIETTNNYSANVNKGKTLVNNPGATIKIGYGNYITVKELAGAFQFNFGDIVSLYDTPQTYLSSSAGSAISPSGNEIGTARMRSLILDSGEPGSASAEYRLYLFDINMNSGKNFSNVKSVYYDGSSFDGICDVVLTGNQASLIDSKDSALLFKSASAVQEANSVTYTYRTIDQTLSSNSTGYISISPPGGSESFPYADGTLSTVSKRDLIISSLGNYQAQSNIAGSVTVSSTNTDVVGISTDLISAIKPGDFIKVANSTANVIVQISKVSNSTFAELVANSATAITGNVVIYFPNNAPISITNRSSRTVTKEANGQLTVFLNTTIANASSGSATSANVAVAYNVTANSSIPIAKTVRREVYARINIANNTGNTTGPWALGVSDIFRMRNVYKKEDAISNTVVTFDANTEVNDTDDFIMVTNNPFANGDFVLYEANNALTGLTDGNTYYVIDSNSSGFSLSNTRGGSKLPISALGSVEDHTFQGPTFYFGPDTYGVKDVTNEFYIDNNQKEDYLDTSYLYRKPRAEKLGNTDILLVKFDAYVTSSSGVKTIKSYPINDTTTLSSLTNTSVHTMEVPEIVGVSGKAYDLRDQFDFRPISANTIPLISDFSNTSITNPTEPSEGSRFNSSEQKFPVPDTNLTADVSYYLGRNDRVILDSRGKFSVISGVPGVYDSFPEEPEDSITLQLLKIPPYPSLPKALSSDMIDIIDTGIANEKIGTRKDIYRIQEPLDASDRAAIQTPSYTMEAISSLERRIKDLEYYVSFTLAETIANMRFIPSSSDSTIDRYKFGFFVDPFTSYSFSDVQNPEYYATIEDNMLFPKTKEFTIEFEYETGGLAVVTPPYVEEELISQNDSTDGAVIPTSTGSSTNNSTNNSTTSITQTTTCVIEQRRNFSTSATSPYVYDDFFYTFSSTAGPAKIFLSHRDNDLATEISQSTSSSGPWSIVITSAAAAAITQNDINTEDLSKITGVGIGIEGLGTINRKGHGPVGNFIEDQHKITWTHDPSKGRFYRVRVYKGGYVGPTKLTNNPGNFKYKLCYPTDSVVRETSVAVEPTSFEYDGIVVELNPPAFSITSSTFYHQGYDGKIHSSSGGYIAEDQVFRIKVTNLKPNTYHKFMFAGTDKTDKCVQVRTSTTNQSGLLTDKNGQLIFDFYYDAGISDAATDFKLKNKIINSLAGVKKFEVVSYDNNSKAIGSIEVKYYAQDTNLDTGLFR